MFAILNAYPNAGIEIDPWCNLNPGGDMDFPAPWRCVGSADDACGNLYLTNENYPGPTEECPITEPGGKDYCVIAMTETEASSKCEDVCTAVHLALDQKWDSLVYPDNDHLDCTVFAPNTMIWVSNAHDECHNFSYEIDRLTVTPFSSEADLLIDGGANASYSSDENLGFIDYRIENCVGTTCAITIEGLELSYAKYSGTYYDSNNDPSPYSVDGVWVGLSEPLIGTVTSSTSALNPPPIVAFPSQDFSVSVAVGDIANQQHVNAISRTHRSYN